VPVYEYICKSCKHEFEALVRGGSAPLCPSCQSSELEKLMSLPSVRSDSTHARALSAARVRDKKQGNERIAAQREYELNHD
jgi:putative FmdB family regulatory protein